MARASAEEWAKRVERWRDSGLTAKEFAAETGLNAGTLAHWSWKLRAGSDVEGKPGGRRARKARCLPQGSLVEISAAPTGASMLEVVVGRARVRVPAGVDEETLACVLRVMGVAS